MYTPPKNSGNDSAFPVGWDEDKRGNIGPSPLLNELNAAISSQITARDHTLVQQSELLACIRPLFRGNASGGVEEELRYIRLLIELGVRLRENTSVVFSPNEDREQFPPRQFINMISAWEKEAIIVGEAADFARLRADLANRAVVQLPEILAGSPRALENVCSHYALTITPRSDGVLAEGAMGATDQARRAVHAGQLADAVKKLRRSYLDDLAGVGMAKLTNTEAAFFELLGC